MKPFCKRGLDIRISLILAAGLTLVSPSGGHAQQLPQYSCRPNDSGDGWICVTILPDGTQTTAATGGRYNSPGAVLPETGPEPAPEPEPVEAVAEPTLPQQELPALVNDPSPLPSLADSAASPQDPPALITVPVSSHELDWVPRQELDPERLAQTPDNCCGAYVDPSAELAEIYPDPAVADTLFRASTGLSQIDQNLISISGDVVVQQGYRTVQNDSSTTIDRGTNTVLMEGNVEFREPGLLLRGNSAFIDSDDNVSRIESARYVLHPYGARGEAESIVYSGDSGLVSIENGEFSRCEPDSNFWKLRADSIVLDQERNRGYAENVSLRLGNVPIFYYPFTLPFPLGDQRISGFLAPSTGSTRSGGFDFELPYYFNLAPHYDATLSPRLISDRGTMVGLEARYLASWSMNTLNLAGLQGDKLYDPATAGIPGSDSPPVEDRWFVGFEHSGAIGRNWTTYVDYNGVSDEDYFYDLGSSGLNVASRTHLNREGRLQFNSDLLQAGLNVQRIQVIDPFVANNDINTPFDRLPQFHFASDAYLPLGFRVAISGQVTAFDRDLDEAILSNTQLANGALVNGQRLNLEPELGWWLEAPGWFARATARYKHVQYDLENQALGTLEDPDLGIPVYSFDGGLVFERDMARGDGWTQTLEPRVYYLYSEFEDQSMLPLFDSSELNFSFAQLFRDDRFSGGDRIADADQVTVALTTRLLNPRGQERARFSVGQIRYFADRLVSLNNPLQVWLPRYSQVSTKSALAGEAAFALGANWRISSDVQWNEDNEEVDEGSFQLRYQGGSDRLFNLGYRFRSLTSSPLWTLPAGIDTRIKQTDVSGVWPVSANWKLLGRWNYDHSNSRNLESFVGIEWSNCCATIRLIGREWVDEDELFLPNIEPNQGIFVQFTLNGLGNLTGGGISNLLSDGILGFRDTEYE